MKVLQLSRDIDNQFHLKISAGKAYVLIDPIAKQLSNMHRGDVQRYEIFEPYYKPYMGHNLDNESIAIWRTGGFGDLLFITPIVEYLKRTYPTCKISVATSPRFQDVWKNNPNIDKITSSFSLPISLDFVNKHTYQGIFEGTIENFKTHDQLCAIDSFAHNLGIFDMPLEMKRPRYFLTHSDINATKNKVRSEKGFNIYNSPYVCFQWKSSSRLRDYPYEKLIGAMYKIQELTGYTVMILTHPNYKNMIEQELRMYKEHVDPQHRELKYINLAGVTSYRQSAAVLALSAGLVGIDSSLTHLAAALSVPSVSIYGPFKAEWRTIYYKNNISLQHQEVCPSAPCAYHAQPGEQDGLPYNLCTLNGQFPQYSKDKFCRVMSSVTTDEIVDAFNTLWVMEKENNLPVEREFKCKL